MGWREPWWKIVKENGQEEWLGEVAGNGVCSSSFGAKARKNFLMRGEGEEYFTTENVYCSQMPKTWNKHGERVWEIQF